MYSGKSEHTSRAECSVIIIIKVIGYVERNGGIRHVDCLKYIPLESHSRLCSRCSTFRENVLRGRLARHLQEDSCQSVEANSHTNFRCLTPSEKCERMKNMATVIHTKDQQIARLSGRINKLVANQGIMVDQDTNNDIVSMMKECGEAVQKDNTNPFINFQLIPPRRLPCRRDRPSTLFYANNRS